MNNKQYGMFINKINTGAIRQTLLIFITIAALTTIIVFTLIFYSDIKKTHELKRSEYTAAYYQAGLIKETVKDVSSYTHYIVNNTDFLAYLNTEDPVSKRKFAENLVSLATIKTNYYKLRYIDINGQEKIRVNSRFRDPYIVPDEYLQVKFDRYFFNDAMHTNKGGVYVSPMDLNVENGVIEVPIKPTIRFCVKVYNNQNKEKGIFAVNYSSADLLANLKKAPESVTGKPSLLDENGFWLMGTSKENEWGFMLAERKDKNFAADYPEEWNIISKSESGQFETKSGLFTFRTVTINNDLPTQNKNKKIIWHVVRHIPSDILASFRYDKLKSALLILVLSAAASLVPAWLFSEFYAKRQLNAAEKKLAAGFDIFTELPGNTMFFEHLKNVLTFSVKNSKTFGLILLELGNRSEIIQKQGITEADNALKDIADAILNMEEENYFISYTGNGRFAVIAESTENKQLLTELAADMTINIATLSKSRKRPYTIELLTGTCLYPNDAYEYVEMYKFAEKSLSKFKKISDKL